MRSMLVAVVLSILPVVSASAGDAQKPAGYGELGAGWTTGDFTANGLATYSAGGFLNLPFAERWNIEIEGRGYSIDPNGYGASDMGGFAHLYWRDVDHFALGGFAGITQLGLYGMQGRMLTGGAEAQSYLGNLTLYGQAAAFSTSRIDNGWLDFDGYFVRGSARYFATPNLLLQADAQLAEFDGFDHFAALSLRGLAEYRFSGAPFAGFASVRWDQINPDVNRPYSSTTVMFGIRAYFGSDSIKANDRRGAPMDVMPFAPTFALNLG
jgi:hypothetical protein